MKYACELCGYEYNPKEGDPENNIAEQTDFEDLPADWVCPLCGASKDDFVPVKEDSEESDD
jgi:rubredoxin